MRQSGPERIQFVRKVVEEYQSGLTLQQVGDLHGITREGVRQILVKAGVPCRQPAPLFTEAEVVTMVTGYQTGEAIDQLADKIGRSVAVVRSTLKENGIQLCGAALRRLSHEDKATIATRYANGESLATLGREYSVSYGSRDAVISKVIVSQGGTIRPRWRHDLSPIEENAVLAEYRSGMVLAEIAERYGVTMATIHNIRKRCGEPKRPWSRSPRK